ncbi:hypothetical protein [Rhodococcus sp. NPDC060176]|uniref:SMODS-associated NUDIX domain-containing protein n=1 Tax=Rhodococcus sp. NPDC060176 TaxID=3347062 RepID=UPI00365BE41E
MFGHNRTNRNTPERREPELTIAISILTSLVAAILFTIAQYLWRHRRASKLVFWSVTHWRSSVRVSVASICIFCIDSKYVLVRQSRRPDQIGPIGGAVDIFPAGLRSLDDLGFKVESPLESKWGIARTALRGFLPARQVTRFGLWLLGDMGRESFRECIERELTEELTAAGTPADEIPRFRHFRYVRTVSEGPKYIKGTEIWQWRMMRVFEYTLDPDFDSELITSIRSNSGPELSLEMVTADEIRSGRSESNSVIGSHAEYLLNGRSHRHEIPQRIRRA